MSRAEVVVVGAGISGLAAAHALQGDRELDADVTVLEGATQVGGVLHTSEVAGFPVDAGADAFLARAPEGLRLAGEAGLAGEVVHPATGRAYVWVGGRLRPLPARTVLGVPSSLRALARSRVLSPWGSVRAALDLVRPGRPPGADVPVGALVARRLGPQVSERLVDPLLGGVYAGRADHLGLDAALPQLAEVAHRHRSLLRAAREVQPTTTAGDGPVFASVAGGLGRLPEALAARLGPDAIRLSTRAALVERVGTAWRVTMVGGRAVVADAIVLATPAPVTARLLRYAAPAVSARLAAVETASVAIVTLAVPSGALARAPVGSGFLVPATEGRTVKACTFTSQKWPALGSADVELVRCSVGRAGEPPTPDDDELVAAVRADLEAAVGLDAAPVETRVTRWPDGLPQYGVGHLDLVTEVLSEVAALPGLALAGSAYGGVGIPACIRSGETAASAVAAHLRSLRRA
ncbi:MAG TPA: protoporphyrinogen oxidase [Mycobacteriales bacterium]|nr:protoporphyrinogen oxidase [Mycobacteriales bacterium]